MCANYPVEPTEYKRRAYKAFFDSLRYTMPCRVCRRHYCDMQRVLPIDSFLGSRACLLHWIYILHNQVNRRLGKVSPSLGSVFLKADRVRVTKTSRGNKKRVVKLK